MQATVQCYFMNENDSRIIELKAPTVCPWCKTGFSGLAVSAACESYPDAPVGVIHLCPACSRMFFATYYLTELHNGFKVEDIYFPREVLPHEQFQSTQFSERIQKVSPQFAVIYNQAAQAENEGLTEICGLGYRRAVEFLVKDFVISKKPEVTEHVLNMPLVQCIKEYIENENVKHVAARVVWLGNDHAHYVPKHTDKDLSDLKALVSLTVKWIDMELETEEFMISVQPKK